MSDITRMLRVIEKGDARAASELLPLLNDDLNWVARQRGLHAPACSSNSFRVELSTGLQRDRESSQQFQGGGHFFAAAAEALRRILVDRARQTPAPEQECESCSTTWRLAGPAPQDIVKLDEALTLLSGKDIVAAQLIQLRYFAGLTSAQAADTLGITVQEAEKTWTAARGWLLDRIQDQGGGQCKAG